MTVGHLTDFEQRVLLALAPYPVLRSASAMANGMYPATVAHRFQGAIGRALRRLMERELVAHASCAFQSTSWKGWYCTELGLNVRFNFARQP